MSLAIASRFAARELRGGLRGFRVFLACLALGVAAIAAVGTVRAGIEAGLDARGRRLLGGDAEVEFTYRFAREDELAWLQQYRRRMCRKPSISAPWRWLNGTARPSAG